LILGYAIATKYRLRRQIGCTFPDLYPLIRNLPTLPESSDVDETNSEGKLRRLCQILGLPGTGSEERMMKNVSDYGLNVPLEILTYVSAYINKCGRNGTLADPVLAHALESVMSLLQSLTGMERVLGTPLPLAYNVAISHITWTYILILPFQLYDPLGWITIPGTLGTSTRLRFLIKAAAYIILGLAVIGRSIENPFGTDAGHLNMEGYIRSLAVELDVLTSSPPPQLEEFIETDRNYPLRHAPGTSYSLALEMPLHGNVPNRWAYRRNSSVT
jgi:ion channel-forming bestrophin family protein